MQRTVTPVVDKLRIIGDVIQYQPLRSDNWEVLCSVQTLRTTPVSEIVDESHRPEIRRQLRDVKESLNYAHERDGLYKVRDELGKLYIPFGDLGSMDDHVLVEDGEEYDYDLYATDVFNPAKDTRIVTVRKTVDVEVPSKLELLFLGGFSILAGMYLNLMLSPVLFVVMVLLVMLVTADVYDLYTTLKSV